MAIHLKSNPFRWPSSPITIVYFIRLSSDTLLASFILIQPSSYITKSFFYFSSSQYLYVATQKPFFKALVCASPV